MHIYDIHGDLQVRLRKGHRGYLRYFDNEYARISAGGAPPRPAGSAEPSRITVEIVGDLPARQDGDLVRTTRFKRLFTFRYLIRGLDTPDVTIYFGRHWVDRVYMNAIGVFLQAQVLEPVMYLKLLEVGVLFMHAGGVSRDGVGLLLPAHGGTGKTTLSMALLAQGHRLLGDDLLLVDIADGTVYPYPRPLHIFTYNVNRLRGATIPLRYSMAVYAKNAIRFVLERLLRTEFLISTRIHADEIYGGDVFGTSVPVAGIAFLRRGGAAVEIVEVTEANIDPIADDLAESADLNDSLVSLLDDDAARVAYLHRLEHETIVGLLRRHGRLAYVNTRELDLDRLGDFSERVLAPITA